MNDAFIKGKEYLSDGCLEGAIVQFEFAILRDKYLWEAYYFLSKAYLEQVKDSRNSEHLQKSSHTLQALECLNPEYNQEEIKKLKSEILQTSSILGFPLLDETAIAQSAIVEDPHAVAAHSKVSRYLKEGPSTRIIRFKKIIETDPANILALSQLGRAYEDSQNCTGAQGVYEQVIQYTLGLEVAMGLYHSEENITHAIHWWADQVFGQGGMEREALALMEVFYRLHKILYRQGELDKSCLMFCGAIDLAININALSSTQHLFNEFLSLCIETGQFEMGQERFAFFQSHTAERGGKKWLDPLLISLLHSRPQEN